eukprot:760400-Hanusia_phi.AAC.13
MDGWAIGESGDSPFSSWIPSAYVQGKENKGKQKALHRQCLHMHQTCGLSSSLLASSTMIEVKQ